MDNGLLTPSVGYKPLPVEYIAGLFDGEGSVTLTKRVSRDVNFVALSLCNTHREVIERVRYSMGCGSVHKSDGVNYPVYNWYASHTAAAKAGKLLLPYLLIKKEEIRLALEWYHKSFEIGKSARAYYRWDKEKYQALKEQSYDLANFYIERIKGARTECRI